MDELLTRMEVAVDAFEAALARLQNGAGELAAAAEERVERIVATVDGQRETELMERLRLVEDKLAAAEQRNVELAAQAQSSGGRKTAAAGVIAPLSKQGIAAGALESVEPGRFEAGALDAALTSLSIEQRFAVKAEMLRAGLLG